jgi:hypothetical protein
MCSARAPVFHASALTFFVQLAVTALLEVVESGSKNLEVAIVRRGGELQFLEESVIDALVLQIEADKEAAAAAAAAAGGSSSVQSAGNM